MNARTAGLLGVIALGVGSCGKVPIFDVAAGFVLADASWFAEEETLFVFYDVRAEQGIGDPSVVEITWATDDERVDWTPITELDTVHTHLPVDCGSKALCGSTSLHVPIEPREVAVRLRYHRDGELALDAHTVFNVVDVGDPWSHRSLLVYGVFDERNQRVQWRARHVFPTIRNEQAQAYGLRRYFEIRDERYGTAELATLDDSFGYGATCPEAFPATGLTSVNTEERAVFDEEDLPLDASDKSLVCAQATVTDATGTFTTGAIAQKNPEVRPAFPVLRSPVRDATQLDFYLAPCDRTISTEHEKMQRQRLQEDDTPTICTDDWNSGAFIDELVVAFTDAVEAHRPDGQDMVLVIGLNRDEAGVADAVEEALARVVPQERDRSSPRLAGAFVFDSIIGGLSISELEPVTLWCPADLPQGADVPDASSLYCAIAPDNPQFDLGPLTFGTLPVLPSREQYLDFIDTFSVRQAGSVQSLTFRVPEFATTSLHVDIGDSGVATFLNDEIISADADDAFSYCVNEDEWAFFVFSSEFMRSEEFAALVEQECATGNLPEDFCTTATLGLLPIQWLGDWHTSFGETTYQLGVWWDFPFLLRMEYEAYVAGSVSAFGLSVPFGLGQNGESYLGSAMWTEDAYPMEKTLTQCRRFCDNPTFDSAGVYHVTDSFRDTYGQVCYLPNYPEPGDSGFPLDP